MIQLAQKHGHAGAANVTLAGGGRAAEHKDIFNALKILDLVNDGFGGGICVGKGGSGRQFNADGDAADIFGRYEAAGDLQHEIDRNGKHPKGRHQRQVVFAELHAEGQFDGAGAGAHEPQIVAHDPAVLLVFLMGIFGAHQIGRHHGGDQARHQQAEQHGNGDRQAKLAEILAGDAGHERHRHKDGDDGEGGGNDGEADFIGSLDRRAVRRFAHADVSGDIFYFNNRIIDEDTRRKGDGEKADQVQRKAKHIHHPERGHGRQRQGDGGDQRGAPVFQERQHHQNGQNRAFNKRGQGRLVVAIGIEHRVIDGRNCHFGVFFAHCRKRGIHHFGHRHFG